MILLFDLLTVALFALKGISLTAILFGLTRFDTTQSQKNSYFLWIAPAIMGICILTIGEFYPVRLIELLWILAIVTLCDGLLLFFVKSKDPILLVALSWLSVLLGLLVAQNEVLIPIVLTVLCWICLAFRSAWKKRCGPQETFTARLLLHSLEDIPKISKILSGYPVHVQEKTIRTRKKTQVWLHYRCTPSVHYVLMRRFNHLPSLKSMSYL